MRPYSSSKYLCKLKFFKFYELYFPLRYVSVRTSRYIRTWLVFFYFKLSILHVYYLLHYSSYFLDIAHLLGELNAALYLLLVLLPEREIKIIHFPEWESNLQLNNCRRNSNSFILLFFSLHFLRGDRNLETVTLSTSNDIPRFYRFYWLSLLNSYPQICFQSNM